MNETNEKIFKSSVVTAILTLFFGWVMFSPAGPGGHPKFEPTVKRYEQDDGSYFIVDAGDDGKWITKTSDGVVYRRQEWFNTETLKLPPITSFFAITRRDLNVLVRRWVSKEKGRYLLSVSDKINKNENRD